MSLYAAVETEIAGLGVNAPGMVAAALAMAEALERKPSALMFKELRETLDRLRSLAPPRVERDALDELLERRNARRTG